MPRRRTERPAREALIQAAQGLMLRKGFGATSVEEICQAADLTKGAFFHHFKSKDVLGAAVVERWLEDGSAGFTQAPFMSFDDPLDKVYGYIDFAIAGAANPANPLGCLVGIFSQEVAPTNPLIAEVCSASFRTWSDDLVVLLDEATRRHEPSLPFDSRSIADLFLVAFEGALILARARNDRAVVGEHMTHYRDYVRLLFEGSPATAKRR